MRNVGSGRSRSRGRFGLLSALGLVTCCATSFAQSADRWAGEWGSFTKGPMQGAVQTYTGAGLSIGPCSSGRCSFAIQVENGTQGNGDAKGYIAQASADVATAHLLAADEKPPRDVCTLRLKLDAAKPLIVVTAGTGDCSYFTTPGVAFTGSYALHGRTRFDPEQMPLCFAAPGRAQMAICENPELAKAEQAWQMDFYGVRDLSADANGESDLGAERNAEQTILAACESASDVDGCLLRAYGQSQAALNARRAAWVATVTEPGNPAEAAKEAAAIAGVYRRRFTNGDVSGDSFPSTDRLHLVALPDGALRYSLLLNFYNGHLCSLRGEADFRRAGFFVDRKEPPAAQEPVCYFEIRATPTGVKLADPTGGCKALSRGGYNGAGFTFSERVQSSGTR